MVTIVKPVVSDLKMPKIKFKCSCQFTDDLLNYAARQLLFNCEKNEEKVKLENGLCMNGAVL